MTRMLSISLLLVGLVACGHSEKKTKNTSDTSEKITEFVNEYTEVFGPSTDNPEAYKKSYENYLMSVNEVFKEEGLPKDEFDKYLSTLRLSSQELEKMEEQLPQRFAKEMKKSPDPNSKEFKLYKTKVMTQFYDELNAARMVKLKARLDQETFSKIVEINKMYKEGKGNNPRFLFPI